MSKFKVGDKVILVPTKDEAARRDGFLYGLSPADQVGKVIRLARNMYHDDYRRGRKPCLLWSADNNGYSYWYDEANLKPLGEEEGLYY